MGLGRDGTLHGTYESRSCPLTLGLSVSRKAGKTKTKTIFTELALLTVLTEMGQCCFQYDVL